MAKTPEEAKIEAQLRFLEEEINHTPRDPLRQFIKDNEGPIFALGLGALVILGYYAFN